MLPLLALLAAGPLAQSYVFPTRPGRNEVRYYDFDWRIYDFQPGDGAGVRLYFYERERNVAEIAARSIADSYRALRVAFRYAPTQRIPYVLYSSHREFRSTNLFEINEFILGVTSPMDLKMSLPYWGEFQRFREVSTHEMAHQFTIQKARDAGGGGGPLAATALAGMPLWFIEGLAEYYAHGPITGGGEGEKAIDEETWGFVRDLVHHPVPEHGWMVGNFFEDRPDSFVHTYKLGQARIAFLVERFGETRVQAMLQSPPSPVSPVGLTGAAPAAFADRLAGAVGSTAEALDRDFFAWLRRKVYADYLVAKTHEEDLEPLRDLPGEPDELVVADSGRRMLYRAVERGTGASSLYLADIARPERAVKVVSDQRPGVESLHPVERRTMALGMRRLCYAAQAGAGDRLYALEYSKETLEDFDLGGERHYQLTDEGIIEVSDPALSPDEEQVAFVGLTEEGLEDLFLLTLGSGEIKRLTHDDHSERDLVWTREGLLFATDGTPSGRYGLAVLDPATGDRRLVAQDPSADLRRPSVADGAVVYERRGGERRDVWRLSAGKTTRLTDATVALRSPAAAQPDGLWVLALVGGRQRVARLPQRALLAEPGADPTGEAATEIPRAQIPADVPAYRPLSLKSWSLQGGGGGVGSTAVGGAYLLFADTLRDKRLALSFAVYGDLELTDAFLTFEDVGARLTWRTGAYHTFREQIDLTFPQELNFYLQREYGVFGGVAWPFDPFERVELVASAGGVMRQDFSDFDGNLGARWQAASGGGDPRGTLALAYGWDSTISHPLAAGPVGGFAAWIEAGPHWLPARGVVDGYAQSDLQKFFRLGQRTTLLLRAAGGTSMGSRFREQFFLSSFDNLRGFQFGDFRLLGSHYYVGQAELRLPLDSLVQVAFLPSIQFVSALDFGGVADRARELWGNRTLAGVVGTNLLFGPFFLRLHFARPIDIGGLVPNDEWITNFSLALVRLY